jgi:hypothetical protein
MISSCAIRVMFWALLVIAFQFPLSTFCPRASPMRRNCSISVMTCIGCCCSHEYDTEPSPRYTHVLVLEYTSQQRQTRSDPWPRRCLRRSWKAVGSAAFLSWHLRWEGPGLRYSLTLSTQRLTLSIHHRRVVNTCTKFRIYNLL